MHETCTLLALSFTTALISLPFRLNGDHVVYALQMGNSAVSLVGGCVFEAALTPA